jgi:hypothetical protein
MIDITFYSLSRERLEIPDTTDLLGDVALFMSPLITDSDDLSNVIPKINAIFDRFSSQNRFTLLYCVVSHDFIIRNHNISHKLKSPA